MFYISQQHVLNKVWKDLHHVQDKIYREDLDTFLRNHIRELKTVKVLVLRTPNRRRDGTLVNGDIDSEKYISMEFPLAVETMQWFKNGAVHREA